MQPRIENLSAKKLVGHSLKMTLNNNRTFELWSGFMPVKRHITNAMGVDLYAVQMYETLADVNGFNLNTEFEKWATVEVDAYEEYADNFERLDLPAGLYAVFVHKGLSSEFKITMDFIFGEWLPSSGYLLDHRPQFEILGVKYKHDDPDSEEEVWIPVRLK